MLKEETSSARRTVHRLRKAAEEVPPLLLGYAKKIYGEESLLEAWEEFWCTQEEPEGGLFPESPYLQLFIPWFLYHWYPEDEETYTAEVVLPDPHTLVAQFLKHRGKTVDAFTRRYLESAQREPLTFWEVQAIEPGEGMLLKDLVVGRERFVHEGSGSQTIQKWDILLGQVIGVDGEYLLGATGPYPLPPSQCREHLRGLVDDIQGSEVLTPVDLLEYDVDFLLCYHECVEQLLHPVVPEIRNTDGEELVFTTSRYTFPASQREAVLSHLKAMGEIEPMDEEELAWVVEDKTQPMMQVVSKAHLTMGLDHLVTECNSRARDTELRNRLQKALGALMDYEHTTHEPLDWEKLPESSEDSKPLDLSRLPEDKRQEILGFLEEQYMNWVDQRIPALQHRTPREAVRTRAGKQHVMALINDWENSELRQSTPQFTFDFNKLRKELGLEVE